METKGCSQRWRTQIPEFTHARRCQSIKDTERDEREKEGGGALKSVSMAPTSRYLTDRQYVMRKPLFSVDEQTSILKSGHPQKHWQKESLTSSRTEDYQSAKSGVLSRPRDELTVERFSLSHGDVSPPSPSRDDPLSPLGVSDLRSRLSHEESGVGSTYLGSRLAGQSLSSSTLEVQSINPPLRPRLSSTVLHPTYTPRSGQSRRSQNEFRVSGRDGRDEGEVDLTVYSSGGYVRGRTSSSPHKMSPYQANYWSCAIPKGLPPSPDRDSPGWDHNREYQALLDYTYPLRPGKVASEWKSPDPHRDPPSRRDLRLQDSGIDLDQLCSSTSLSAIDVSPRREEGYHSLVHRSGDRGHGLSKSSEDLPYCSPLSPSDPIGLSMDSLNCSKDRSELKPSTHTKESERGRRHQRSAPHAFSASFIRSTSLLPRWQCAGGPVDEEYRPLPDQLEELQVLSRQVREVTAQLGRPVTASWESLEPPGTTSVLSSVTLPEKQDQGEEQEEEEEEGENKEQEVDSQDADQSHHRDSSDAGWRSPAVWIESVDAGLNLSSIREVEALAEQLSGLTLPESHRRSLEEMEETQSLVRHIQIFCSHLGQLIQWLYAVSEKMDLLAPPTVDLESVKSSLAEYQRFQREVSDHQPLTSSVLQSGQRLLSCMDIMSPVLRDTLLLIERQSRALETHTEQFFSSILLAMDSLTHPSPTSRLSPV
ncbi:centrosomal protein of 68 kDa isoform X2 [Genypterus blacodes]|uniref:centrosomal protein of 68 kDa isoform X2 n=1 Tax=Genypterus blacodes TaxID=154954 RepID=UPI003F76DADB